MTLRRVLNPRDFLYRTPPPGHKRANSNAVIAQLGIGMHPRETRLAAYLYLPIASAHPFICRTVPSPIPRTTKVMAGSGGSGGRFWGLSLLRDQLQDDPKKAGGESFRAWLDGHGYACSQKGKCAFLVEGRRKGGRKAMVCVSLDYSENADRSRMSVFLLSSSGWSEPESLVLFRLEPFLGTPSRKN